MNATALPPRPDPVRPELGALMSVLAMKIDEMRAVVVQVTSPSPREGTSTIAREIAGAAAASGWCKVALIDAQPSKQPFAPGARPGLVEVFERGEEPVLEKERVGTAWLSAGRLSANPGTLSRIESVRGLYGFMRKHFNLVVVDCAPVLSGQQSTTLAAIADGTILVIEAERTRLADVTQAREQLEQFGATLLGVVFNKSRRRIPWLFRRFL